MFNIGIVDRLSKKVENQYLHEFKYLNNILAENWCSSQNGNYSKKDWKNILFFAVWISWNSGYLL